MLCFRSNKLERAGVRCCRSSWLARDCGIAHVTYLIIKQADKRRHLKWRFLALVPEGEADDRPDSCRSSTDWPALPESTRLFRIVHRRGLGQSAGAHLSPPSPTTQTQTAQPPPTSSVAVGSPGTPSLMSVRAASPASAESELG